MKKFKRALSLVLGICLCLSMLGIIPVQAAEEPKGVTLDASNSSNPNTLKRISFMDGTIDSSWTILNPDPAGYSVVPDKGLRLPTQDSDIYSTARDWKNVFVRPVAGDWDVVSAVSYSQVPYANYQQNALLVWQDEDNYIKLDLEYNNGNLMVQFGQEAESTFTSVSTVPFDAASATPLNIYYRIKKEGNNYTGSYSKDGINYTTVGSTTFGLQNTQIGLFAAKNSTNDVIDTYVKYIEVLTPALNPAAVLTADSSVKPGASFIVGIGLGNLDKSVYAEDITLTYDANVFEYVSAAGANSNIQIAKEDKATTGKVRLMAANIGGVSGASTQVLELTFKVKGGVQNTTGNIAVTQAKLGVGPEGTVLQATLDTKNVGVGSSEPGINKEALITAINNAQGLYDGAVVGTLPGQYPQAAKDALLTAIDTAKAVKDNASATQSQVDGAVTALNTAIDTFKAAAVKDVDFNKNGSTDVGDLAIVAYYYGKDSTAADWTAAKIADINGDNKIDISDLAYVASKIQE